MPEAATDAAEDSRSRHAYVVEEEFRGIRGLQTRLVEIAAALEAGQIRVDRDSVVPLAPARGSVLAASTTTPAFWPLVMKVLEPLMT